MSNTWRDEYISALHERDAKEKSRYAPLNDQLIDAFTKLLDRTAALEASKAAQAPSPETSLTTPRDPSALPPPNEGNAQLRSDLAEALRSNGQLQARIKNAEAELLKIKAKDKSDSKTIETLTRERDILARRIRDRDDELRGKKKHFDDIQDEIISLNLQLNMAEQNVKKLKAENKELIDRWMALKGQEADEMNKTFQGK